MIPELERSVLLLESTWWRNRSSRVNWLARERSYLADLRAGVRIQPASFTFSSRRGTIPLTVANDLAQEVVVRVRLDPQTIQLRVSNPADPVRIGPRQKAQVQVDAVAVAGGQVLVDSSLHTPSGVAYGQPVPLRVSITDYGTVALYITVAAAGVLFLTAGVRVLRRVRAAALRVADRIADASSAGPPDDDADELFPGMSDDPGDPQVTTPSEPSETAAQASETTSSALVRNSSVMAAGTTVSRVLGFARTAVLAAAIGTAAGRLDLQRRQHRPEHHLHPAGRRRPQRRARAAARARHEGGRRALPGVHRRAASPSPACCSWWSRSSRPWPHP